MPGLRCLRCGSAHIEVIREIRADENSRSVDTRCTDCREQSVLTRAWSGRGASRPRPAELTGPGGRAPGL